MSIRVELQKYLNIPDWDILARCMIGEAEGESELGKLGVACVIRNRVHSSRWGNTYHEVILQDKQFSCFNRGSNRLYLIEYPTLSKAYGQCKRIAKSVIMESALDITGGADHYFNDKIVKPSWADKMIRTCRIGDHVFYLSLGS